MDFPTESSTPHVVGMSPVCLIVLRNFASTPHVVGMSL